MPVDFDFDTLGRFTFEIFYKAFACHMCFLGTCKWAEIIRAFGLRGKDLNPPSLAFGIQRGDLLSLRLLSIGMGITCLVVSVRM
jgi:hypothetical protein